jgi:ATP-dependent helicase/nuclease subunit B
MDAIAPDHHAHALWERLMADLAARMAAFGAHPARTAVLLPYFQLLPLARRAWARHSPDGFAPRFETTKSLARAASFEPSAADLGGDMARDLPAARHWLERAGLAQRADDLAPALVEAAWQLMPLAAAVAPADRPRWAAQARAAVGRGMDAPVLQLEAAVAQVAVEWVAASAQATDALLESGIPGADLLVVLQGLQSEPLHEALVRRMGDRACVLPLASPGPHGRVALHACADAADEAERAAACVLRHVEAGHVPVALAATDRVLTRRIAALLAAQGVPARDEPGWKLSTTRSAARVMSALKACAWDASSDEVLDWIKNAPAVPAGVAAGVERRLRRNAVRLWRSAVSAGWGSSETLAARVLQLEQWREPLQGQRPLADWLCATRELLQACGQWPVLLRDAAGAQLIARLRLHEGDEAEFRAGPQAARRLRLDEFIAWVSEVLESASFKPEPPAGAPVVILPLAQMLGRPFGAVVLAGCDERTLPAAPDPSGPWTAAQREGLGLPSRETLAALQQGAWHEALRAPHCDVLWRSGDEGGEPLLPSPLVEALQLAGEGAEAADPRNARVLAPRPVQRPHAIAPTLVPETISASAYEDLRRCPYRFFGLRQLGLQQVEEIEAEVDKRDFGTWLHSVLRAFHEALRDTPTPAGPARAALLDAQAGRALADLRLEDGEFLPFEAAWPAVRDGYLAWLSRHEAAGAVFVEAEGEHEAALGARKLLGRIDRVDRLADGSTLVMDYKTESLQATRERMKRPLEDTQLAFYAALLGGDGLQAAYLNVGERGEVRAVPHDDVLRARELLMAALEDDLRRIGQGEPLPALGEGRVCEFCAARGLCRRDFWND